MVELILAGVIISAVCAAAVVTGVRDRRRTAVRPDADREPGGEPIPSGWTAHGGGQGGDRTDPAAGAATVR
ncbi:hypothetical protein [Glycomyces algeriensis]|uniref:Uncharacterized protein n=1 Tax=Glycomyces algeriensis TaxID=256037 RepID=A0A9W6G6E3_9ACTN|nr:hypothetical protein [Glycomyces algeriensis]MDA1365944.1 hypothetical protein [Glycomyces algeriensis]MDR7349289.1 hypothetical protein [Glycomyces algeriensis]GLI41989.1 hypothetical protein GALLR39Z86_18390 [Glycomyces algeriensis]